MSDIYHVLSRGVDKRNIFLDKQDYFRFIHNLFVLNEQRIVHTTHYALHRIEKEERQKGDFAKTGNRVSPHIPRRPRKLLVDIHAFSLMPNHYHLLLSPKLENGIPKFMNKLNMAYAKYFNYKYQRKGTLFESRYKSILISEEPHFHHLPYYIHFNPLDLKFKEWRKGYLSNYKKAMEFLNSYRWSSYLDYIGKKNFPSVTNRTFLLEVFRGEKEYKNNVKKYLKDLNLERIEDLILE